MEDNLNPVLFAHLLYFEKENWFQKMLHWLRIIKKNYARKMRTINTVLVRSTEITNTKFLEDYNWY